MIKQLVRKSENKVRSARRRRARPSFQLLEDRTVMSGDLYLPPQVHLFNPDGFLTEPSAGAPMDIALQYLHEHAADLGLDPVDLTQYTVTTNYVTEITGVTHLSFRQTFRGLEVVNSNLNVNITADGRVINVGGGFVSGLISAPASGALEPAALSATEAVAAAAVELGYPLATPPEAIELPYDVQQGLVISEPELSTADITPTLIYVAAPETGAELSWQFDVQTPDGLHWYNVCVDATDATIRATTDYASNAQYEVVEQPRAHPNQPPGGRTIEVDPHIITPTPAINPSPFGWHDTNGVAGAEFTTTRGNNVNAYADRDANNAADIGAAAPPDGGPTLNFTGAVVPLDLTQQPVTYTQASIANLFYWNNVLHDVHYLYGFTESARNFQINNYGRGGLANDAVLAETQDGSGTNNANFFTPPDGNAPRMQMFEFTSTSPRRDSSFDAVIVTHEYGHGVSNRLTGNGSGLNALQSAGMGEGWGDWWGLMFTQKTAADTTTPLGAATYSLGQPDDGPGFREFRYQFAIGNQTLETFLDFTQPGGTAVHQAGTRWAAALWDLNHLLIQKYGYEPNIYNSTSTAGNIRALHLVMNGLKLQPLNPSFIQARDAILLADTTLNGGANHLEIWTAFARRGLGQFASTPSSSSSSLTTSFVVPPGVGGLAVTASVPANNSTITVAPTSFQLTVSAPVNPATLQASDLLVRGIPANSVSYVPGSTTITFNYISTPVVQGLQSMTVAAGAFNRASDNNPVSAFSASFRFDATPLQVVATNPPINGTFTLPTPFTYDVQFNEQLSPSSVQTTDLVLSGLAGATVNAVTVLPGNTVARFTLGGITTEGTLTASIAAGAITDQFGNAGNAFTANYQVDFGTVAYPTPLESKNPPGSMIYDPIVSGVINFPGDTDTFTLDVDAGQTITVLVDPTGATGQELFGGVGNGSGAAAGRLLRVNQTNAAGTVISDPVNPGGITGLVYDPSTGFFLASTVQTAGDFSTLVRIDPVTGANLGTIGTITDGPTPIGIGDLAIQPGTNNLYGIRSNTDGAGLGGRLYLINKSTGAATLVGNTGTGVGGGISFAPDGSLYQTAVNALHRLNPANAAIVATVPMSGFFDGLAIRADGVFFAATGGSNDQIFTINPVTGATTLVGSTGQGSTSDLAFGPAAGIAPNIQLRDPANVIIGGASAGAGQNALLQTVNTTTAGTYRIAVTGAGGSVGGYSLQVILNAALEAEGVVTGATNETQATAQDISGSLINPRPGLLGAQRAAVLGQIAGSTSPPVNLIQNGTFDNGSFAPWTVSAIGINGWQLNNGALDPQGPATPQAPISGAFDVVTDPTGPGLRSISQPFVVPSVVNSATLTWSDRIQNFANAFQDPNQEYRVQITDAGGAVLQTVFSTNPGDPLIQLGPNNRSANVTALLQSRPGQTLRLRFEEQDSLSFFNVTLDNISLSVESAPPSSDVDFYSLNLLAGNRLTAALEALSGTGVNVELRNSAGAVVATGVAGPTNFDRVLNYAVTATGTYFVRVTGTTAAAYSLVVTKNAAFDTEPNDNFGAAQNITDVFGALGSLTGGVSGPPALFASGNDGSQLIRINPATGVATLIGAFGFQQTWAGAFTPDGTYWTIVNGFNGGTGARLATVNLSTGVATPVGNSNWTGSPAIALEADNAGNLYSGNFNGTFFSVNKTTGQMTPIGQMNLGGLMDFTFDNAGVLWAVDGGNNLWRVNTATGQGTLQGAIIGAGGVMGMMVDPVTGTFYVSTYSNPGALYQLNTTTRVVTLVGNGLGSLPHGGDFSHGAVAGPPSAVVPSNLATVEGNLDNAWPFNLGAFGVPSMRYQQIYSASQFSAAGIIDAIRFRRSAGQTPFTAGGIDIKINLSYAATSVGTASPTFANNVGSGVVTVFDGLLTLNSNAGNSTPNPFDVIIDVANTFNYDPAQGNLLVDIFMRNSPLTRFLDAADSAQQTVTQRVFSSTNVNATSGLVGKQFVAGDTSPFGLVTQFDFAAGPPSNDDWYSINVTSTSAALRVQTSTPADGPGQFVNTLNPKIELYSPSNVLLASGTVLPDGRNEFIQLTPSVTGLYRVRVLSEGNTKGEYFLSKNFSPTVTATVTSPINEGQSAILNGTISDDPLDSHTVVINWGPGETPTTLVLPPGVTNFSASHLYADDNPSGTSSDTYAVTVTVTDEHGAVGTTNDAPAPPPAPVQLITNGGFETGNFNGWTITTAGSGNWFINNGTFDPLGDATPQAPIAGNFDAVTSQGSPSTQILSEAIVIPSGITAATLSWSDRIRSFAPFDDVNQVWRVRILDSAGNTIQEIFSTDPGDPQHQLGPNNRSFNVTSLLQSLAGQTIHVSFQVIDNLFFFNTWLDNVSLLVTTGAPTPPPVSSDIFTTHNDGTRLGRINPVTGAGTDVGSFGTSQTWAAAFDTDGTLYTLINGLTGNAVLARVNQATGAVTTIGTGLGTSMITLEVAADGTMYGIGAGDQVLYRINKTLGTATPIGNTGINFTMDTAFNSAGTLYATTANGLWTVNTTTGASTFLGTLGGPISHLMGLMFDGSDNLFATDYVSNSPLFRINLATMTATSVGPTGFNFPHGGDIFVSAAPPPAGGLEVVVNNVAPSITSLTGPPAINENETATVSGTFFDPGVQDTHTVVITWGAGEGNTTLTTAGPNPPGSSLIHLGGGVWSFSASHQYLDDNPTGTASDTYAIDVFVTDDDGGSSDTSTTVQSDIFSTHNDGTRLGTIDTGTGVGADIGPFGTTQTFAAAFDIDGTLYTLINGLTGNAVLARVNQATGAVTPIGPGLGRNMITLEVAADGTMYGIGFNDQILYRINKSLGTATPVGNTGINSVMDTAINSAGTLYATVGNGLWTVNTTTGASTFVGTMSGPLSSVMGLAFDASDTLFATDYVPNSPLFRIDLTTLAATPVGLTGFNFPHGGDIFVSSVAGLEITVHNVAPSITSLTGPPAINENDTATVSGMFFDPGLLDTHTVVITWGAGEGSTTLTTADLVNEGGGVWSFSASHQYLDDNPTGTASDTYAIAVVVTDDDGGSSDTTTTIGSDIFSTHNDGTRLGTIDPDTGVGTDIGPFGTTQTWAAAFDTDGTLYTLINGLTGNAVLARVNQATGAVTTIGTGLGTSMITLEVAADGTMYGIGAFDFILYRINKTLGTATPIGNTGINFVMDTAINSAGTLYATVGNGLWTVNTTTGASTFVGTMSGPLSSVMGLAFDASDTLFATDYVPNSPLFRIDLTTLVATPIGLTGFNFPHGGDIFVSAASGGGLEITVNNVAPVVTSVNAPVINEGQTATVTGTFFDPGLLDTHTVVISWGSGEGSTTLTTAGPNPAGSSLIHLGGGVWRFTATHLYPDDNPSGTSFDVYAVSVLVTDDDTGSDTESSTVTVNNVAPEITSVGSDTIDENGTATISGTFFDPGLLDTHTVVITWGSGEASTTLQTADLVNQGGGVWSFSASHQYLDDNPTGTDSDTYAIGVLVTDDDTRSDEAASTVTVNNVAPVVAAIVGPDPSPGVRGQTLAFSTTFTDVGTQDTHTAVWDWGDNSTSAGSVAEANGSGSVTGSHVYTADGTYTVTLTVTDDDTGATAVTKVITIVIAALQTDACDPTQTQLAVGGTTGADVIFFNPVDSAGNIEVIINGVSHGVFAPTGRILAFGQAGDDDIQAASSIANATCLYGDNGNDRLKGSNGPSVLLGGAGDDVLIGGSGRDLMIGGLGADKLVGNSDEDILLGGTTAFDAFEHALCVILEEWNSERDYATRIANIQGTGTGPRLNENYFLKTTGADATVFDDGVVDRLIGSSGIDWFFAGLGDIIANQDDEEMLG